MKLLEVKELKTYFEIAQGQVKAVDGVNFSLDKGETLGLVGESGCGKTTSALSIARLLPKEGRIVSGQILLEGKDLVSLSETEMQKHRWKDVSVVFQGAMNALNPVKRIGDQIGEAVVLHQQSSAREAWKRAEDLLELMEIPAGRAAHYPHEFSGGMKQRVMIAMALACNPKVIIGDEPTTALDVMVQAQILNLIEKLQREFHMGFILITHDLSILAETCTQIAVMYAGKIVEQAEPQILFRNTAHPYTKKLISCFPDIHGKKNVPPGIPGTPPSMLHLPEGCAFAPRCDYATDLCRHSAPASLEISPGHHAACHRWKEVSHG